MASKQNTPMPDGGSCIDKAVSDLTPYAKYKARSYETSSTTHIPYLLSLSGPEKPRIVLFGNSMFERMKTTGQTPDDGLWPSRQILNDEEVAGIERFGDVFNAGVGGDKIGNNVYRLVGDDERGLRGLLNVLKGKSIAMWVVCCGTNDLHPKHGLREADLMVYKLMLSALISVSDPETKFLVVGISHRNDIRDELVDEANVSIRKVTEDVGQGTIKYEEPCGIEGGNYLEDHVHLNRDGYRAWMMSLVKRMREVYDGPG